MKESSFQHIVHPFPPICNAESRILILGTLPSVKSRENAFYYGHPRNRFWQVLSRLFLESIPETDEQKTDFLLYHHIALWDVVQSCDIRCSSDSSIKNAVPTDLKQILRSAPIQRIYANGGKAAQLYQKYQYPSTRREIIPLPSTSPANASWSLERLTEAWSVILK